MEIPFESSYKNHLKYNNLNLGGISYYRAQQDNWSLGVRTRLIRMLNNLKDICDYKKLYNDRFIINFKLINYYFTDQFKFDAPISMTINLQHQSITYNSGVTFTYQDVEDFLRSIIFYRTIDHLKKLTYLQDKILSSDFDLRFFTVDSRIESSDTYRLYLGLNKPEILEKICNDYHFRIRFSDTYIKDLYLSQKYNSLEYICKKEPMYIEALDSYLNFDLK